MDLDTEDFEISTPKFDMDEAQVDSVLAWLKAKGASKEVLGTINEFKAADKPAQSRCDEGARGPWRSLQSSRDKLVAVEKQLFEANNNVNKYKSYYDEALEWQETLLDKKDAIDKDIVMYKSQISTEDPLQEKVYMYEDLFKQLQSQLEKGIPEDAVERSKIFNIVFKGQKEGDESSIPVGSQNESQAGPASADAKQSDDTLPFVDTQGFGFVNTEGKGFGPTNPSKAQPSPYSDGGRSTKAGKGRGIGAAYGSAGASVAGHSAGGDVKEASPEPVIR